MVLLVDDTNEATVNLQEFIWTFFTRFEPAADIHTAAQRVVRHHLSYTAPIVIDARMKPPYPEELFCGSLNVLWRSSGFALDGDPHLAPVGHGMDGIDDQVREDLLDLGRVDHGRRWGPIIR